LPVNAVREGGQGRTRRRTLVSLRNPLSCGHVGPQVLWRAPQHMPLETDVTLLPPHALEGPLDGVHAVQHGRTIRAPRRHASPAASGQHT
jgi:hypothetical protein